MDIYRNKSRWKILLTVAGFLILIVTMIYANFLAKRLAESEKKNTTLYALALEDIRTNEDVNADFRLPDTIMNSFPLPVIVQYESGNVEGKNWGTVENENQNYLSKKIDQFLEEDKSPIEGPFGSNIYLFNSPLLTYIKLFPIVQILLVGLFMLLAYFLFSATRRAEQNRVWAGMAKETAHQLGTPISAILAWIEHLKLNAEGDPEQLEIVAELTKDVDRLELVADRFSKIGSTPKLTNINIYDELEEVRVYMEKRASRNISFNFHQQEDDPLYVMINKHLFDWVIENLIRNALDAMGGKGLIKTNIYQENNYVCLDLSDTGKGIPASKLKTVFNPGFTTKKRGWGLGLSLAKRIIENYHKGKIFVKSSKINEGTTFTIKLPKAQ